MDLKSLSDHQLLNQTETHVQRERELLTVILYHLMEIERRRLFSALKYTSLFDYCVRHLKYSEDQAYRRISAMRVLAGHPDLARDIDRGELNVTHLSLAKSVIEKKQLPKVQQAELIQQLKGRPTREAKQIVRQILDKPKTCTLDVREDTFAKLQKIFGLLAHRCSSLADAVDLLAELGLSTWDPLRAKTKELKPVVHPNPMVTQEKKSVPWTPKKQRSRHIPASVRRAVWVRDEGTCTQCGSKHGLQIDHVHPFALGGSHDLENLRLLCWSCNQRIAVERFGVKRVLAARS